MTALRELIERIEAAEEGSRELDGEVWCVVNGLVFRRVHRDGTFDFYNPERRYCVSAEDPLPYFHMAGEYTHRAPYTVPKYTTSLDAAVSLVPEGAGVQIERFWVQHISTPVWSAEVRWGIDGETVYAEERPTPALALCCAALKARLALEEPQS
ncbi:hypothetical protein [Pseudoroseomonas ludipueritiae]|uniref:Phage ABA sandwich domain-containing protein n=1 Tax=Pseudoroseomonas ludipueritiae TaxID=198093 RepID=A0ABR7REB7_9PROT|nr:hypothetical protein [Pseudoroseomonas ludipueritiae]MBC9180219.1 hypothetical protein [Pseudoroseomonas ludipueritiae]